MQTSLLIVVPAEAEALFNSRRLVNPVSLTRAAMDRHPVVYILASGRTGTLYVGVTSDLIARVWQHREHVVEGFTKEHGVTMLVWYEVAGAMEARLFARSRSRNGGGHGRSS